METKTIAAVILFLIVAHAVRGLSRLAVSNAPASKTVAGGLFRLFR
jgi:hypothetical protein